MNEKEPHSTKYECNQPNCMKDSPTESSATTNQKQMEKPTLQPCRLILIRTSHYRSKNIKIGKHEV
jgi:hypothetical protein